MGRSAAFRDHLDELGIWFPDGDGDALRAAATGWSETADFVEDIAAVLVKAGANITDNYRGEAAERFFELWQLWTGKDGYLAITVKACRRLAATLNDFGGDVDRADETLLGLIDEALDLQRQAALARADRGIADEWLRDAASKLAGALDRQAAVRTAALAELGPLPAELAPIDPERVDWVAPGDPRDLGYLATETVDFGAGPGTHAGGSDRVDLPIADTELPGGGLDALADRGAATLDVPPVPDAPDDFALPDDWAAASGGGGGAGGGVGGGFEMPTFEPPSYDVPEFDVPDLPEPADHTATWVGSSVGAGAVGAGVAAAAAAKAGRNAPMMPFVPMGAGGVGGDDGKEPIRRRRRVVVVPPVA